ncbi:MAG: hypothetical protein ACJ72K_11715 [Friedmanniella sp.]
MQQRLRSRHNVQPGRPGSQPEPLTPHSARGTEPDPHVEPERHPQRHAEH